MIDGAYIFKLALELPFGIKVLSGQEITISNGVIGMNGYPLPPNMQKIIMAWLNKNNNQLIKTKSW